MAQGQREPPRRAIEPCAVHLIRRQAVERVRPRVHEIEMRSLQCDGHEDVTDMHRVALRGLDTDEMVTELAEHRLAQLTRLQTSQGRRERRDEPGAVTLRPPEVATMGAAPRGGGLLLRHVPELDLSTAARELGAKVTGVLERRGAIGRVG